MKKFFSIYKSNSIFNLINHSIKLCLLGTNGNYWKLINFCAVSILTSIFESLPIMIVVPFIGIITNPEKAFENKFVRNLANLIYINDPEKLILPVTLIFISIIIFSSLMKLLNTRYLVNFNASVGHNISKTLFQKIIYAPYEFHITKSSTELLNASTTEIENAIFSIQAFLTGINSLFISIFILITVFLINIKISIYVVLVMGTAYTTIAILKNKNLKEVSRILSKANRKKLKITQESIFSIRDLTLNGNYKTFLNEFNQYSKKRELALSDKYITGIIPKYLVEAMGLSLLGLIAFSLRSYENIDPLPILAAISLGLQKLLPQLQIFYTCYTNIAASYNMSRNLMSLISNIEEKNKFPEFDPKRIIKLESLQLVNVSYKYPKSQKYVLKNINLTINKGDKIGIIGETGAGKSTIVELITTLLEPVEGKVLFNGNEISYKKNTNRLISWRKNISYVPQFIALIDSTILENIALGKPANEVNLERAKDCAKTALIYDHIKNMKGGMYTNIGERGIKLSGGQIQRIGIARALYNGSEVLVLDEATSALDSKTEEKLVKSIAMKNKKITIIAISHRLSTLKNYDRFIKVEKNSITEGTNLINL